MMVFIDFLIIALLIIAIRQGIVWSRKADALRFYLIELGPALQAFSDAVDQSERSVRSLKEVVKKSAEDGGADPELPRQDAVQRFFDIAQAKGRKS